MKKIGLLLVATLFVSSVSCASTPSNLINAGDKNANEVVAPLDSNYVGASFVYGEQAYQLTNAISETANTFEACIRMEKNSYTTSTKSVIFGNYNYYNSISSCNKYVNYEVNANGNVCVYWMGTLTTFTSTDVRTGEWVHIAVVRDTSDTTFKLYINGVLAETSATNVENSLKEVSGNYFRQRIGGDLRDGETKRPFWGEIGHISLYKSSLNAESVLQDYQDVLNISYKTRSDDLVFSTNLRLGDDIAKDNSINCNDAHVVTNDYFYEGEMYETVDYSFGVVGDTQRLCRENPNSISKISQWAIANKEERNLQSMFYMGDLTDGRNGSPQDELVDMWTNVSTAMSEMDGKVPYVFVPGNHDYKDDSNYRDLTMFNEYYPYSKYSQYEHFEGAYQEGQIQNTYYTFEVSGIKYLVLALEFGPEKVVMEWAETVLDAYSDHRAIVITHGFLDGAGELYDDGKYLSAFWYFSRKQFTTAVSSKYMWEDYLSNHENVFMILSGHSVTESIANKELQGKNGNIAMAFRVDSSYIVGGKGYDSVMGLFSFDEANTTLTLNYFSVEKNMFYNVQNQMRINFSDYTRYTASYYNPNSEIKLK